jgi:hypothetical protein
MQLQPQLVQGSGEATTRTVEKGDAGGKIILK